MVITQAAGNYYYCYYHPVLSVSRLDFRRGEFTGLVVWGGRREDGGGLRLSAAVLSHAGVCCEVTREEGKLTTNVF